jgi:hypothetical protein
MARAPDLCPCSHAPVATRRQLCRALDHTPSLAVRIQPLRSVMVVVSVGHAGWWAAVGWCPLGGCQRSSDSAWVTVWASNSAGVEVGGVAEPDPLQHVFVAWMGGVGHRSGEVGVAPDAPAVLRRGGASSAAAAWIADRAVRVENLFHQDIVFPVAEVVGVSDRAACRGGDLLQRDRRLRTMAEFSIGDAELAVWVLEDVQVAAVPAKLDLNDARWPTRGSAVRRPGRWPGSGARRAATGTEPAGH